jgi:bifunctional UDP-N-acetylglucosamine pyrophosphorylase/glucosamine-1-phosphate N-acetyltransferase
MKLDVVILAAGKGKRMLSKKPKVMHALMGKPMIGYVVDRAHELSAGKVIVVTGHEKAAVEEYLTGKGVAFALQAEQKGTAHALLTAAPLLTKDVILVLYGDVPLIRSETLASFIEFFKKSPGIAFMTTEVANPQGYGRVIMKKDEIEQIVEDVEATERQKKVREINTGICMLQTRMLLDLVKSIKADNKKGEYYLTDIVKVARKKGIAVKAYHHSAAHEVLGINVRNELLEANLIMKERILDYHLERGVGFADRNVYIEDNVKIGLDTVIFPNCFLMGATVIGADAVIGPNVVIKDSIVSDGVVIEPFSSLDGVRAEEGVKIGPFARLRPGTLLKRNVKIGNFVEVKKAVIGEGSKASHLTYIGDAEVGSGVNIGAGTITCNYDGKNKHKTVIGDGVFVGSNTEIVAPVTIGKNSVIGAGTTVTHDVPEDALVVSRVKQRHIEGYGRRKK